MRTPIIALLLCLLAAPVRTVSAGPTARAAPAPAEALKARAASRALRRVRPGSVLGLGGGSTVEVAVRLLGERYRRGALPGLKVVPASARTAAALRAEGVPLTTLAAHPTLDLLIDGADEVDPRLDLIKGGGGMLTGELRLARAARRTVIIVDESKLSRRLGTRWSLPIDVRASTWRSQLRFLRGLGATKIRRRAGTDGKPFVTDEGNYVLLVDFGPIARPAELKRALDARAGIVSAGLFLDVADEVIVARPGGTEVLRRARR